MKRTAKLAVPLLLGLVLGLAAASAFAMPPRGTGCSGGAALGVCAELGFSVSLCCALFGM